MLKWSMGRHSHLGLNPTGGEPPLPLISARFPDREIGVGALVIEKVTVRLTFLAGRASVSMDPCNPSALIAIILGCPIPEIYLI